MTFDEFRTYSRTYWDLVPAISGYPVGLTISNAENLWELLVAVKVKADFFHNSNRTDALNHWQDRILIQLSKLEQP